MDLDIVRLLCCLCYDLILQPMQLICCGLRICELCSESKLKLQRQCPFCTAPGIPEVKYDRGFRRELESLSLKCPKCNDQWFGLFTDLPRHLNNHYDLECENCGEKFIFSQQVEKHLNENCKKRLVECPLVFLHCSNEVIYEQMNQHCLSDQHQNCLIQFIKTLIPQTSQKHSNLALETLLDEQYRRMLTNYIEKIDSIVQEIDPILGKCSRLSSEGQQFEAGIQEVRAQCVKFKESFDKNEKLAENINQILANMNKLLHEIKSMSMVDLKLISSDNTYKFKVNILSIIDNEQAVQSEPVHTSQSGYKLALSCSIYLDQQNHARYVSISFIILCGEFDTILSWPFVYPVTLAILDLTKAKRNIEYSIPWHSRTAPLHQPLRNQNTVIHIERFCSVDTLIKNRNSYLQDDFIFIQMHIDFMEPGANVTFDKDRPMITEDSIQRSIVTNIATK
ncbi:unnamed protein product [Rotaria socialis]|uniref:MATH domain-containing protein n=2 Tax=Rotaria socialis TaxID=392032 RepID=A0A818X5W6_9BILA|nr:unnamed protein product [Rotaria socialis]